MTKIKQVAIAVGDPDKAATFYEQAVGLKIIGKFNNSNEEGYFLTDGDINIALLKFKNEAAADGAPGGTSYRGLHHIGYLVDNLEEARAKLEGANAPGFPLKDPHYVKFNAPDGEIGEITEVGWLGMSATLTVDPHECGPNG